MKKTILKGGAYAFCLMLPVTVAATPLYDTFGPLPGATFGGTGIPNEEVAISSQFEDDSAEGTTTITVALSATQRYSNPVVTNDGAGTFFATPGSSIEGQNSLEGALWNFNYYIDIDGPIPPGGYDITLFYDFNPAFDNGPAGLGTITSNMSAPGLAHFEGSENLMFGYLEIGGSLGGTTLTPPTDVATFDPNALGEYNFALQVSRAGWAVEAVRMDVQIVPIPAAAWLFGSAMLGFAAVARRKKP